MNDEKIFSENMNSKPLSENENAKATSENTSVQVPAENTNSIVENASAHTPEITTPAPAPNTATSEPAVHEDIPHVENPFESAPTPVPEMEPAEIKPEYSPSEAMPELKPAEPAPEIPNIGNTPEISPLDTTQATSIPNAQPSEAQATYNAQTPKHNTYGAPYNAPCNAPYSSPYSPQYQTVQSATPAQKPKASAGARVMIISLFVLLGLLTTALVGICSYFAGVNNNDEKKSNILNRQPTTAATSPNEDIEQTTAPDYSYLYAEDGEITLNPYPTDKDNTEKYNTRSAFEKVSPSTVGVMRYTDKSRETLAGQGTGIVINTDGYIVTNSHVIGDSMSGYVIDVVLTDGNTYMADIVGFDTRTDLAVLKITASGLVPAEFASSDYTVIGEDVIAVGNPGGIDFQNSLTRGIISAKDRTLGLSTQVSYLQTDAAINPGNSGGPLCNIYGQVIGINSAKISSSSYEGMGFAIPSTTVKEVADDLIKQGYVSNRVKIGITGTAITSTQAEYNNVPQGILISVITEGGPCDNGVVKSQDIITKLDDTEIKSFSDIYTTLAQYSAGDKVTLTLYRYETDEYIETEITLQADNGTTQ